MYEKRKYGSKIRFRVTDAISNDMAKRVARDIRGTGTGAGVDTWKGQFAVWADKKLSSINFSYFKTSSLDSTRVKTPKTRPKDKRTTTTIKPAGVMGGRNIKSPIRTDSTFIVKELIGIDGHAYELVGANKSKPSIRKLYEPQVKKFGQDKIYVYFYTYRKFWAVYVRMSVGPNEPDEPYRKPFKKAPAKHKMIRPLVMEVHKFYDNQQPRDRKQAVVQAQYKFQISKREASEIYTDWQKIQLSKRPPKSKPKRKRQLSAEIRVLPSSEFPIAPNVIMENHEGTAKKFWGWHLLPSPKTLNLHTVDILWGRIDAKTFRMQTRTFQTKYEMEDFISKKFKEKQLKGYKVTHTQGTGTAIGKTLRK